MKRLAIWGLLVLGALALALSARLADDELRAVDSSGVAWKDLDKAMELASEQNKVVVLDVYTDWCSWCKKMDRETYRNPEVIRYVKDRVVMAKLNPEKPGTQILQGGRFSNAEIAARFRVRGFPTTVFLTPQGDWITSVSGFIPADRFLPMLRYIAEGHYKTKKYEAFLREQKSS